MCLKVLCAILHKVPPFSLQHLTEAFLSLSKIRASSPKNPLFSSLHSSLVFFLLIIVNLVRSRFYNIEVVTLFSLVYNDLRAINFSFLKSMDHFFLGILTHVRQN